MCYSLWLLFISPGGLLNEVPEIKQSSTKLNKTFHLQFETKKRQLFFSEFLLFYLFIYCLHVCKFCSTSVQLIFVVPLFYCSFVLPNPCSPSKQRSCNHGWWNYRKTYWSVARWNIEQITDLTARLTLLSRSVFVHGECWRRP